LLFVSATTGRNVPGLFAEVKKVFEQQNRRVSTGQLNKFVEKAVQKYHPPMLQGGKRLRIYYLAQVDVQPPRFILFVNRTDLMCDTYKKYLIGQFRQEYQFLGAPIKFFLKARAQKSLESRKAAMPASTLLQTVHETEEWEFDDAEAETVS
jgi:GTP-binding protein